jgi:hypothetical protein
MTGGSPAPKKTTSSVEKIVNMMQDTVSFAGIEGGIIFENGLFVDT